MYEAFRTNDGPTLYPSNKTPVTADVLLGGFIFASAILGFSFIVILFGSRGKRILFNGIIIFGELLIVTSIILCNFGQDWEVATVTNTTVQYKAGLREEIKAEIGVNIGLRSVNITLKSNPTTVQLQNGRTNETIDYNERFSWNNLGFVQGRLGFGPNAGLLNREFREAQARGAPYPILWVAEYFTIDGEGIRWGRFYRQAGYYAHIFMWLAFPVWMFTILLFNIVLRYGAYFSMLTGVILAGANVVYSVVRNPTDLVIPIGTDHVLMFSWGWCYWVNVATALLTFIVGVVVFIIDVTCYQRLASWCGVDILQEIEEIYGDPNHHWSAGIGTKPESPSRFIKVEPVEPGVHSRPIMSAKPREENYGPSMRLVRKKTMFGGFQRDNTILLARQYEETSSTKSDDKDSVNISLSSQSSGYLGSSASSSRNSTPKSKTGRQTRRVIPVRHK